MIDKEQQDFFDRITLELNGINPDVYVAKKTVDLNWQALKQERLQPYVESAVIEKISNASLMLWANEGYTDGNFQCDIYCQGTKQHYDKNLIFKVTPEMTPRQYKIWDLVKTDAHLSGCRARRAKLYNKNHAKDYSAEFAHFEIWRGHELIWACLLVEDWLIPMNIYVETYLELGNIRLTAPWNKRQRLDDWYQSNI